MTIVTSLKERFPSTGTIGAYYLFHPFTLQPNEHIGSTRFRAPPRTWSLVLAIMLLIIVAVGVSATIMLIIRDVKNSMKPSHDDMPIFFAEYLKGRVNYSDHEDDSCLKHCGESRFFICCLCSSIECSCDQFPSDLSSSNSSEYSEEYLDDNDCFLYHSEPDFTTLEKCDEIGPLLCQSHFDL